MDLQSYYYIYSAMTQAIGALIALIGVFVIFKMQLQRARITGAYTPLIDMLGFTDRTQTREEIGRRARARVENDRKEEKDTRIIEQLISNAKAHESLMNFTLKGGVVVIVLNSFLLICYILALHYNYYIFNSVWKKAVFNTSVGWAVSTVFIIAFYIIHLIKVEIREYLSNLNW